MKTNWQNKTKQRLALLFCCMVACGCGGMNNARGIFIEPVVAELGITQTHYALVSTMSGIISSVAAIAVPHLLLRIGSRWVLAAGAAVNAAGYYLAGRAAGLAGVAASFVLTAVGYALLGFTSLFMILREWYREGYGLASSFVSSCYGLSAALYSPFFAWIIERRSWREAYSAASLIGLLLCLPAVLSPFRLFSSGRNAAEVEKEEAPEETYAEYRKASVYFILLCVLGGSGYIGSVFGVRLSSVVISKGMTLSVGALCTSMAMIGIILSKMVNGSLSSRYGAVKTAAVFCLLSAVAETAIILAGGETVLLASSFLFGTNYSISGLSASLATMELYGPKQYGFAYSTEVFICTLMYSAVNLLWGLNYNLAGSYNAVMVFSAGFAFLAAGSMFLLDRHLKHDH